MIEAPYLLIVRWNQDFETWVVDEDSHHILENGGDVQELTVSNLRQIEIDETPQALNPGSLKSIG